MRLLPQIAQRSLMIPVPIPLGRKTGILLERGPCVFNIPGSLVLCGHKDLHDPNTNQRLYAIHLDGAFLTEEAVKLRAKTQLGIVVHAMNTALRSSSHIHDHKDGQMDAIPSHEL